MDVGAFAPALMMKQAMVYAQLGMLAVKQQTQAQQAIVQMLAQANEAVAAAPGAGKAQVLDVSA